MFLAPKTVSSFKTAVLIWTYNISTKFFSIIFNLTMDYFH